MENKFFCFYFCNIFDFNFFSVVEMYEITILKLIRNISFFFKLLFSLFCIFLPFFVKEKHHLLKKMFCFFVNIFFFTWFVIDSFFMLLILLFILQNLKNMKNIAKKTYFLSFKLISENWHFIDEIFLTQYLHHRA